MTPILLDKTRDAVKVKQPIANDLIQDLNLTYVFRVMAKNDDFIYRVSEEVMMHSLVDLDAIAYRQEILRDCVKNASSTLRFYHLATKAVNETSRYKENSKPNYTQVVSATTRLSSAAKLLVILIHNLQELKVLVEGSQNSYSSEGMRSLMQWVNEKVTNSFLEKTKGLSNELQNLGNCKITMGAKLGPGLKGSDYILRDISIINALSLDSIKNRFVKKSAKIDLENIGISKNAKDFQEAALIQVLKVMNRFSDTIIRFFEDLRYQLAFYTGGIQLHQELTSHNAPLSYPIACPSDERKMTFKGLYDLSLSLEDQKLPIANDADADENLLFVITGANQGGKSTYLRSLGLAQLMMQCGMFVAAKEFRANVCDSVFTHFTRGEDINMNSGKLDKELMRMNQIINRINKNALLLMNESFATTTEREGSRIAKGLLLALYEKQVKTIFVTHLFELAEDMYNRNDRNVLFLRAERQEKGERTFRIIPGKPLFTSYGEDLYNHIIETQKLKEA